MNRKRLAWAILFLACLPASAQTNASTAANTPPLQGNAVPWASVGQVNALLGELDSVARVTSNDLARVRIDKWKTDSGTKQQVQANSDSIQRNLQSALPAIIGGVRNAPDDMAASFKLYRNLDAIYDVLGTVAESAGAFGSKNDYQALANDLGGIERIRRELADRVEGLATAKETELARLRNSLRAAQTTQAPPKKVVVDENEPVKKPRKKKPAAASNQTASPASSTQKPSTPQ
jgi:hypothetical protein